MPDSEKSVEMVGLQKTNWPKFRFLCLPSDEVYQEVLKWQTHLHSKSANEVQEFLNANLDQLAKVREVT